jgi:hypothetical protein
VSVWLLRAIQLGELHQTPIRLAEADDGAPTLHAHQENPFVGIGVDL